VNPAAKLGAFGLVLLAVLGGGAALGQAVGPIDTAATARGDMDHGGDGAADMADHDAVPAGLQVAQDGYTLSVPVTDLGRPELRFTIVGPDGEPVTRFDELHERRLHLVIVSRDLQTYAHLHPAMDRTGEWSVALPGLPPGSYRVFADVQPTGAEHLTLGIDAAVAGTSAPRPIRLAHHDEVDGFEVDLESRDGTATITVRRDGRVVTTEPYLGAAGHLVAVRQGDLAYLHVHPLDEEPAGPVRFGVEYPSAGTYALFFDFQVDGVVHTARFAVEE
jgi:hypothetical protein